MPPGVRQIKPTLSAIVAGRPDAVTMHKGIAASAWMPYAGRLPMILQSTAARPDDSAETVFSRADGALYRAKQTGRNRIEVAEAV